MRNENSGSRSSGRNNARRSGAHSAPAKAAKGRSVSQEREEIQYSTGYDADYSTYAGPEDAEAPVTRRNANTSRSAGGSRSAKSDKSAKAAAANAAKAEKAAKKAAKAEAKAQKRDEKALKAALSKPARKAAFRRFQIILMILLCLILLAGCGVAVAGYKLTVSPTNFPNVYIGETYVGGMTYEETLAALDAIGWDEAASEALRVRLPAGASFKVDLLDSGAMATKETAAAAAYRYGHDGSWIANLMTYVENKLSSVDVLDSAVRFNEEYIRQQAQSGIDKFMLNTAAKDGSYQVLEDEELLRMVKGAGQMEISLDALCTSVANALANGDKLLDYNHIDNTLPMPDFNAIHTELGREPEDAYFIEGGFDVADEVIGCSFDVQAAEQTWQAAQPGDTVEIPLVITYPEVTGDDLRALLFRDKLGSQMTSYSGSTPERINNIHLAASKINELIMMPGDEFSYNDIVGERTREAGFQPADAYNDGEVVQELGGGICQVSSTLYCAIRYAQLQVTDRTNHYFKVAYLPYSMDATVSWGGPEFKFVNNRDYPIKILTYCDDTNRELTVEVWGTDVDGTYVELPHETFMIFDEDFPDVVIGYAVQAYRNIYDRDGNYIEQVKEPYGYSIYHFHDYDINWPAEKYAAENSGSGGGDSDSGVSNYTGGDSGDSGSSSGDSGGDSGEVVPDIYA